jgi:hypothetical protein
MEEMEMAREIHKALLDCMNNNRCRNCEFKNDTPMSFCKAEYIARAISKHYQPKLPEDSVVLSKEEYKTWFKKDGYFLGYKDGEDSAVNYYENLVIPSKEQETAEKILERGKYCIPSGLREWIIETFDIEVKE